MQGYIETIVSFEIFYHCSAAHCPGQCLFIVKKSNEFLVFLSFSGYDIKT
jgi:hypothetical protein